MLMLAVQVLEFVLFAVFSYVIYIVFLQRYKYFQLNVPRVKSKNGILNFIFGESMVLGDLNNRHKVIKKWRNEAKSDVFAINVLFRPLVLVFDKDLIHLLSTDPSFHKTYELRVILKDIADGMLLQEEQEHAAIRKSFLPIFNLANVQEMFPEFVAKANELINILPSSHSEYPIMHDIQKCTLDIIAKVAFNYDMKSMTSESAVSTAFDSILTKSTFGVFFLLKLVFPVLNQLPISKNINKNDLQTVQNCIDNVIQQRIKTHTSNKDLLTSILQSVQKEGIDLIGLRKQILTFLSAGHETTATALSWALYALALHPEYQKELRDTLTFSDDPTWDDVQNNKFLQDVCDEVMRLYSPAAAIIRRTTKAFTFKGMTFPKDTRFNVLLQEMHFDCEDPLVFNPKREKSDAVYMPFWIGNRGCIGKQLAIVEFKTILATLIKRMEFGILDRNKNVSRTSRITQRPDALFLKIEKIHNK